MVSDVLILLRNEIFGFESNLSPTDAKRYECTTNTIPLFCKMTVEHLSKTVFINGGKMCSVPAMYEFGSLYRKSRDDSRSSVCMRPNQVFMQNSGAAEPARMHESTSNQIFLAPPISLCITLHSLQNEFRLGFISTKSGVCCFQLHK